MKKKNHSGFHNKINRELEQTKNIEKNFHKLENNDPFHNLEENNPFHNLEEKNPFHNLEEKNPFHNLEENNPFHNLEEKEPFHKLDKNDRFHKKEPITHYNNGFIIKKSPLNMRKIPKNSFVIPNILPKICGNEPIKINPKNPFPELKYDILPDRLTAAIEEKIAKRLPINFKCYFDYYGTTGTTDDGYKYELFPTSNNEFEACILGRIDKTRDLNLPNFIIAERPMRVWKCHNSGSSHNRSSQSTIAYYPVIHLNEEDDTGVIEMLPLDNSNDFFKPKEAFNVTAIANNAFKAEELKKDLSFPEYLKRIGKDAFADNQLDVLWCHIRYMGGFANNKLSFVNMQDRVERIENYAFTNNKLDNGSFSKIISYIGDYAFTQNRYSGTLTITSKPIEKEKYPKYDYRKGIIAPIKHIGDYAFAKNKLEKVVFEENVNIRIEKAAFSDNQIKEIVFPKTANISISENAFNDNRLKELILPRYLNIGINAFASNKETIRYVFHNNDFKKDISNIMEFNDDGWYGDLLRKNKINGKVPLNGAYSRCYFSQANNIQELLTDWEEYYMFGFTNSDPDFIGNNVNNNNYIYHLDEVFVNAIKEGESGVIKDKIDEKLQGKWSGSCHGFTLVRKFDLEGHLNLLDWTSTDGTLRTLRKPADELALFLNDNHYRKDVTNLINYYHLTIQKKSQQNISSSNRFKGKNIAENAKEFLKRLKNENDLFAKILIINFINITNNNVSQHSVLVLSYKEYDEPIEIEFRNSSHTHQIICEVTTLDPNYTKYAKLFITNDYQFVYSKLLKRHISSWKEEYTYNDYSIISPERIIDISSFFNLNYNHITAITPAGPVKEGVDRAKRNLNDMNNESKIKENYLLIHLNRVKAIIDMDNNLKINPHEPSDYREKGYYIVPTSEFPTDFVEFHLPHSGAYQIIFNDKNIINSFEYVINNQSISLSAVGMKQITLNGLENVNCPGQLIDIEAKYIYDLEPYREDYITKFSLKKSQDLLLINDLNTNSIHLDGKQLTELKVLDDDSIINIDDIKDNKFILDRSEENKLTILDKQKNIIKKLDRR